MGLQSACSSKYSFGACHKAHYKSLSLRSQSHARCPLLVSKMFLKCSPLAVNLTCPNDDPRPTFNHYMHCPFNNYSTPLHNFNSRSMKRIPVINCLIERIFWGHVNFNPPSHPMLYDVFKVTDDKFDFSPTFYLCCHMQVKPDTTAFAPNFWLRAKLRLHIKTLKMSLTPTLMTHSVVKEKRLQSGDSISEWHAVSR